MMLSALVSSRTIVDPYGNGVASATGVPGDHVIVSEIVSLARAAGIYAKGGHTGTCKGIFSKCIGAYHLNEEVAGHITEHKTLFFDICSGTGPTSPTPIMAGRA